MKMLMITYVKAEAIRDALQQAAQNAYNDYKNGQKFTELAEFLTKAMDPKGTPVTIDTKDLKPLPEDEYRG